MAEAVIELPEYGECIGSEQLTVGATVKQFTTAKYKNRTNSGATARPFTARVAVVFVSVDSIRVTMEGTDPVAATTGQLFLSGQHYIIKGAGNITKFKATRETTDATIDVAYFL